MGLENEGRRTFEDDRLESPEEAFRVDLDGYEGPLDLLLDLARRQKVDLARISVLALAEQYLKFIEAARRVRLELAADYLVMAAWLAYLKSRLLLPAPPKGEEPDAAALAANLAQKLKRLQKIRAAAELLGERPHMGRDIFARGAPEGVGVVSAPIYQASLFDLLSAYARQRQKHALANVSLLKTRTVWSLAEAREALERILGMALGMDGARRLPDPVGRKPGAGADRARLDLFGDAGAGEGGADRPAPGSHVRAAVAAAQGAGAAARAGGGMTAAMTRRRTPLRPSRRRRLASSPARRRARRSARTCACARR